MEAAEARGARRLGAALAEGRAARAVRRRVLLYGDEAAAGAGARAGRRGEKSRAKILKRVLAFVYNNADVFQGEFRSQVGRVLDEEFHCFFLF